MNRTQSTIKLMPKIKKSKGLTLIELLVTIAIIGILAALASFSFQESQAKSRDGRRKADLEAIRKAMELAKQDSPGGFSYPTCGGSPCRLTNTSTTPNLANPPNFTYIKSVPTDPKIVDSNANYWYEPTPSGCLANACTGFTLTACLENTKDPAKDSANKTAACPTTGSTAGTTSYTISNL